MPSPILFRRPAPGTARQRRPATGAALFVTAIVTSVRSRGPFLTSLAMALAEGTPALLALVGTAALNALLPGAKAQRPPGGAPDDFDASIPATS